MHVPEVIKEGKIIAENAEDYEKVLGVTYVENLIFSRPKVRKWVEKKTAKAEKKGFIAKEQKWLGAFYDKEIDKQIFPKVTIRYIDSDIGYGVFAEEVIKKRTYIGEYAGILRKRKRRKDQLNSYTFEYLIGENIDTPYTIDARETGNFVRFINHDAEGNADPMLVHHDKIMRVIIYTNRDVLKGEQITYDYGPDYWSKRDAPQAI